MTRRLRRVLAPLLALATVSLLLATLATSAAATGAPTRGKLSGPYSYTNASGTRQYWVYLPPSFDPLVPRPLVVELHGCNPDKAVTEARWSRFDDLAERKGFVVVYPEEDTTDNGSQCWNWFEPPNWTRAPSTPLPGPYQTTGEPSIIAGITRVAMSQFNIDGRRVYVGGISAGGAQSTIMAVTFPDLYAAALVYAGCEYEGTANCLGSVAGVPAYLSGQAAAQEMTRNKVARVVPVIVVQGTADPVVPYPNSTLVVQQFLAMDAFVTSGSASPVPVLPASSQVATPTPPEQAYTIEEYPDAAGCVLVERWTVNGMAHQWSDVTPDPTASSYGSDVIFNDPYGPDITSAAYAFFSAHPMPAAGVVGCVQAASTPGSAATGAAPGNPPAVRTQGGGGLPSTSRATPAGLLGTLLLALSVGVVGGWRRRRA